MEGDLRGFRKRAQQQQEARRDQVRAVVGEHVADLVERLQEVHRPGVLEQEERAQHQSHVADYVDHECLQPGPGGGGPPVPERDQQVGSGADERPSHDQQNEVARQHQQQHREDEVVEVAEVAPEAPVLPHVGDRVQVDQRRDAGDDEDHEHRQRIDQDLDLGVDPDAEVVAPERRGEHAMGRLAVEHPDQRQHGDHERQEDRGRPDPPRAASRQPPVAEPDRDRPDQREQQHQPRECRDVGAHWLAGADTYPCSSESSSTSTGRRRR